MLSQPRSDITSFTPQIVAPQKTGSADLRQFLLTNQRKAYLEQGYLCVQAASRGPINSRQVFSTNKFRTIGSTLPQWLYTLGPHICPDVMVSMTYCAQPTKRYGE